MSKATILFLTLILCACDNRRPTRFIRAADAELLDYCEQASERWYDATGIATFCSIDGPGFPLEWGTPGIECAVGSTTQARIRVHKGPPPCNQAFTPTEGFYVAVVTHELGHLFTDRKGGHAESGVMARVIGSTIDRASIDWLCKTAECEWEEAE